MTIDRLPFEGFEIVKKMNGGSNRKFYRVRKNGKNYVVMESTPREVERYYRINNALMQNGINVPSIYEKKDGYVLMEDVGDMSLFRLTKEFGFNPLLYQKVIDALLKLQGIKFRDLPRFSKEKLQNEYEQFKKFYAIYKGIDTGEWEIHVEDAVKRCMEVDYVPMHRDFQSTNIYIKENKVYFLDFQDMHLGPFYFDLASLLYDPYIMMQNDYREELLEYYAHASGRSLDKERYLSCAMLRIMQALSAYIRLSMEGKEFFRGFIRKGECTLKNILRDLGFNKMADSIR